MINSNQLTKEKIYIFKYIGSRAYLQNMKQDLYTFDVNEAEKFNEREVKKIGKLSNLQNVEYEKEKYENKEEMYTILIEIIAKNKECKILCNDLKSILNNKNIDILNKMLKKYPNNRLLIEMLRVMHRDINKLENEEIDFDYEKQILIIQEALMRKCKNDKED